MFKLYIIDKEVRREVIPINGVYTVTELGLYYFVYKSMNLELDNPNIFIEDVLLDRNYYTCTSSKIELNKPNRLFEDYFGFASLKINNELFKLNIQIEKLKLGELEEILLYLWGKEDRLFDVFFSKSTVSAQPSISGEKHNLTSKFLVFADHFFTKFDSLFLKFKNAPYSVLRREILILDYEPRKVSSHTIHWLLDNIDNVHFDEQTINHPDLIKIGREQGFIDKIETTINQETFSIYENEIILGSFQILLNKLNVLKRNISMTVNLEHQYGNDTYADFRDLKKLPYVKLFKDSCSIEHKLILLYTRYKNLFKNTRPRLERPRITNVFSHKIHYKEAYKLIKNAFDYKFNFDGDLNLFNIKKLSELYEIYNLHQLIESFTLILNLEHFEVEPSTTREDGIINNLFFNTINCKINIFYEPKYPNKQTRLVRIDSNGNGKYYCPDYLIEITVKQKTSYIILDSKYTRLYAIRSGYLNDCIFKYIINTGIKGDRYTKIDDLVILYPGEHMDYVIKNEDFSPQITILPSKPLQEKHLKEYIYKIIKKYIPTNLYKEDYDRIIMVD